MKPKKRTGAGVGHCNSCGCIALMSPDILNLCIDCRKEVRCLRVPLVKRGKGWLSRFFNIEARR